MQNKSKKTSGYPLSYKAKIIKLPEDALLHFSRVDNTLLNVKSLVRKFNMSIKSSNKKFNLKNQLRHSIIDFFDSLHEQLNIL